MSQTAHDYLHERFRNDAATLLDRAASLARGVRMPGPDATLSRRMADACTDVAARIASLPRAGAAGLDALLTLATTLDAVAGTVTDAPAVRAVYAGAATRMREVVHAERAASADEAHDGSAEGADVDDDDLDDIDESDDTDDDVDDDDPDTPPEGRDGAGA